MFKESTTKSEVEVLMPFKKISANRFRSPSGRIYTKSQVARYYARGGKFQ